LLEDRYRLFIEFACQFRLVNLQVQTLGALPSCHEFRFGERHKFTSLPRPRLRAGPRPSAGPLAKSIHPRCVRSGHRNSSDKMHAFPSVLQARFAGEIRRALMHM